MSAVTFNNIHVVHSMRQINFCTYSSQILYSPPEAYPRATTIAMVMAYIGPPQNRLEYDTCFSVDMRLPDWATTNAVRDRLFAVEMMLGRIAQRGFNFDVFLGELGRSIHAVYITTPTTSYWTTPPDRQLLRSLLIRWNGLEVDIRDRMIWNR